MNCKIKHAPLLILVILFLAGCNDQKKPSVVAQSFDSTLVIHLNAIQNSDLAALEPTVADSVILISPAGQKMHSKKSFMTLHENWFKQKYWQWEGTLVRTESTDSLGYALIQYTYTQKDSVGNISFQNNNYLVLIFRNFQNGWQLVHDQNTPIPK
jgi:ketosteroid isomerase-like protein